MKASVFNIQKFSLHDGPGIRTTVFFSGCPLHCRWCANPECRMQRETWDLETLLEHVCRDKPFYDKSGGGVTLSGGEVLLQQYFAAEFAQRLHEKGVSVAMETAGNIPTVQFSELAYQMDFIYLDCKHYDPACHLWGTGVSNLHILRNIQWLASSGIPYRIRIPVIPGFNNSLEEARGFGIALQQRGVTHAELLPFHQLGEGKYEKHHIPYEYASVPALTGEQLGPFREILLEYIPDVILK